MTLDVDAAAGRIDARRRPTRSARRGRGGLGHRAHRQRQHGQRHPPGAGRLGRRSARARLIAYGGNGPVHAWAIAAELGMRPRPRPQDGPGLLRARPARGRLRGRPRPLLRHARSPRSTSAASRRCCDELDDEVTDELAPTDLDHGAVDRARFVQMAYAGQNFDMSVPRRLEGADRRRRCSTWPTASTTSTRPTAASPSATSSRPCAACASPRSAAPTKPTAWPSSAT